MEANKILSANILDLIFDDRNKEYGAYELRVTYPRRIKKSLIVVVTIAAVAITGAALANSLKPDNGSKLLIKEITLEDIKQDVKEPEPIPEPIKKIDPPPTRTVQFTTPVIVKEDDVDPPPTQIEIADAKIDVKQQDGVDDIGLTVVKDLNEGKGIIEDKKDNDPNKVWTDIKMQESYNGDWPKFLTRNLVAGVPVENGAPVGRYTVMIQFVVDTDGNLSDIKALTNYGYGMEQEAIRVLKKAKGWKPGIQNGHEVKSLHKQPITFLVEE